MKQKTTDLSRVLRHIVALMLVLIGYGTTTAAEETSIPTSDEINAAILVEGSIPVEWTNDPENPWIIDGDELVNEASLTPNSVSTISFSYSSEFPVEISFDVWREARFNDVQEALLIYVDNELKDLWNQDYWFSENLFFTSGSHTIRLENHSGPNPRTDYQLAKIKKLQVLEYSQPLSVCLTPDSEPLTFENDPENPWIADEDCIKSTSSGNSSVTTTFTVERPAIFSCTMNSGAGYYSSTSLSVLLDGEEQIASTRGVISPLFAIEPGLHTIEFKLTHDPSKDPYDETEAVIKDVMLYTKWTDVTLAQPGTLGLEIIKLETLLNNAKMLSISGEMNDEDWTAIKQISKLYAIDLKNTSLETIPERAFYDRTELGLVSLPETLRMIESYAFSFSSSSSSDGYYPIQRFKIPASVEEICRGAWSSNYSLKEISFPSNSKLKIIGNYAFAYCRNLYEFIMPNTVTSLTDSTDGDSSSYYSSSTFVGCSSLTKLHLSEALTFIPHLLTSYDIVGVGSDGYSCPNLKEVNIPSCATFIGSYAFCNASISEIQIPNSVTSIGRRAFYKNPINELILPNSLTSIGEEAFYYIQIQNLILPSRLTELNSLAFSNCTYLETVKLNSVLDEMEGGSFYGCPNIHTVISTSPTPPSRATITADPFSGLDKSKVKLIVPDFAALEYKLDYYWQNFIIETGEEASISDYWVIHAPLTLSDENRIRNTPDIDIDPNGALTINGSVEQPFNNLQFNTREDFPARYLSECENVTANSVTARFRITADKWHYFTVPADVRVADVTHESTSAFVIRTYNGEHRATANSTSGNWTNVTDGVLKRGQGYVMQANRDGWVSFPVESENHQQFLGNQEVTIDLNAYPCETTANANWNFLGNPYPSYYDIYYMDINAPITIWTGSAYRALSLVDDNYALRPMQAFFVQKPESNEEALMLRGGKQTTTTIRHGNGTGKAPTREPQQSLRELFDIEITLDSDTVASDMTRVVLNEAASLDYEINCDASKFMSLDQNVAQLYSIDKAGTPLAINERPYFDGNVKLGVYTPAHGEMYRIEAPRADRQVYLYDAQMGIEHDLSTAAYIFMAGSQSYDTERFSLRFAPGTTSVEDKVVDTVRINATRGAIYVTAPEGASVNVYSANGNLEATAVSAGMTLNFILDKGIYVVTVDGETFKTVVK